VSDPFASVEGLMIEFVDSSAGSGKSYMMIAVAIRRAREDGVKTIVCVPTLELVREFVEFARRDPPPGKARVPIIEITSREDDIKPRGYTTTELLHCHITRTDPNGKPVKDYPDGGHLVFITHETFYRMGRYWPRQTAQFEIVIDEALEVVLTRPPFRLHDNDWVLTSFLTAEEVTVSPLAQRARRRAQKQAYDAGVAVFTQRDARTLVTLELKIAQGPERSSPAEIEQAKEHVKRLRTKRAASRQEQTEHDLPDVNAMVRPYMHIRPKDYNWVKRRVVVEKWDDVYAYINPVLHWLIEEASLFTDWEAWVRMYSRFGYGPLRGRVTISGFRRPEVLSQFGRVTIMSALFRHTMLYDLWSQLGVVFKKSSLVPLDEPTTPLGSRRLQIYWMTDQGWSKRLRDRSGGIAAVFDFIIKSGIIHRDTMVCVCTNKDDASEDDPTVVREHFPNAIMMPHNSRGQNRFRGYHHLVHCAALNAYTADIRWLETVLGIDSKTQRIARTGQEVYQTLMRLSLRDPNETRDITLVVMDKDVAEWLVQWFEPSDQVDVTEIDSSGVVRPKGKPGRPTIGNRPMTAAERQLRRRLRRRDQPAP